MICMYVFYKCLIEKFAIKWILDNMTKTNLAFPGRTVHFLGNKYIFQGHGFDHYE